MKLAYTVLVLIHGGVIIMRVFSDRECALSEAHRLAEEECMRVYSQDEYQWSHIQGTIYFASDSHYSVAVYETAVE
jgi:hypothetical protein